MTAANVYNRIGRIQVFYRNVANKTIIITIAIIIRRLRRLKNLDISRLRLRLGLVGKVA